MQVNLSLLLLAMVVCSVTATATVCAQEDSARVQFNLGIELYEDKKFDQAAVAFERAYELKPSFKLLYNIGQTKNELGNYAGALDAYERYLNEGAADISTDRAEQVRLEIARLKTLVGTLNVKGGEKGATVYVDRRLAGTLPLARGLVVNLGEHAVSVKQGTEELHSQVVQVAGGQRVTVVVPQTPQRAATAPPAGKKRRWTWVATGIGTGALICGGVIGGVSVSKRKNVEEQCTDGICPLSLLDEKEEVAHLSLAADVFFVVGAAGIVTGAVLFFLEPKRNKESVLPVAVGPTLHGDGLNVLVTRSF